VKRVRLCRRLREGVGQLHAALEAKEEGKTGVMTIVVEKGRWVNLDIPCTGKWEGG